MEFKPFPKIAQFGKAFMQITQKIHGTNAQVFIYEKKTFIGKCPPKATLEEVREAYPEAKGRLSIELFSDDYSSVIEHTLDLLCGSRTRWIYPGDDNYGFAAFVYAHKEEFIQKLGVGQHFGEWAGPGINSGEGLSQKTFVLFDHWKFPPERPLPPQTVVVPVLYSGPMDLSKVQEVMEDLRVNGSKLVPGFMRPEGVVIMSMGERYKKVFDSEETQWKKPDQKYRDEKAAKEAGPDFSHLLQPIRLEKLLSRDEKYLREYPKSLNSLANAYFDDLVAEGQVTGSEGEILGIKKASASQIYKFLRAFVDSLIEKTVGF